MKRLLTDYLPFSINEDQKIVYHQLTLTDNEYTDNEKRPIVDINIEIGTEELLEKVEQERQNSLLYFHKKNNKRKKDNEKNEKEKEKEKEKGNEKEEEKEEEKLKRVIVEMQVYNDNNFLRRIILNSMKSYSSYFKSDSKNEDIVDIYSLNFLYGKLFKRKKRKNKSSNNENNEIQYIHDMYINDPRDEDYCFENLHIFVVELSKFDINNFNENDEKDLWTAFFKCLTYKIEYNKKRQYDGEPKTVKVIINHLTEELYKKLSKIDEIKEAIDYCEVKENTNVNQKYYNNYVNSILDDQRDKKIEILDKQIDVLEKKAKKLEDENNALEAENNAMKTEMNDMKTEMNDMKTNYEKKTNALEVENNALEAENNAMKTENNAMKTENNAMKTENNALKTEMNAMKTEMNDIKTKYDELIKLIEKMRKNN